MFKTPKPMKKAPEFKTAATAQYDWPTLLDGQPYELKKGEHFDCTVSTFTTLARARAGKAHKKIQISANSETGVVILQARDMTQDEITAHDIKVAERKANKAAEQEDVDANETGESQAA